MTNPSQKKPSPKLLSGGNPQIPKGDGDGPVQDYIAAMPDWSGNVGSASMPSSCGRSPTCTRR